MSINASSTHASKFRNLVLESADRILAKEPPKSHRRRKHPLPSAHRKNRLVPVDIGHQSRLLDTVELAENDSSPPPLKMLKMAQAVKDNQPLCIVSPSKVNTATKKDHRRDTEQSNSRHHDAFATIGHLPKSGSSTTDAYCKGVQLISDQALTTLGTSLAPCFGSSSSLVELDGDLKVKTASATALSSNLPQSSAPSSNLDDTNYVDLEDSIFFDLPEPLHSRTRTTSRPQTPPSAWPIRPTANKMKPNTLDLSTPITPASIRDSEPSPLSVDTPLTPKLMLKPFVRKLPFKETAPNLPQIPSLKVENRIQTCFRVAEVLRLRSAQSAVSKSTSMTIELYARVVESWRKDDVQIIQFADLFFPDRPPYLSGNYATWKDSEVFDLDGRTFSTRQKVFNRRGGQYKLCRAVLQMSAKVDTVPFSVQQQPTVEVLSIWETDWEEIERVRGIVEPDQQHQSAKSTDQLTEQIRIIDGMFENEKAGMVQVVDSQGTY